MGLNGGSRLQKPSSAQPVITSTYSALTSLVASSGLVVGQQYSLPVTMKYFQETSAKLKVGKYDYDTLTPEEEADATEWIIVTAVSTSSFDKKALSMKYEGDIVDYSFDNNVVTFSNFVGDFVDGKAFDRRIQQITRYEGEYYQCIQTNFMYPDIYDTDYFRPLGITDADLSRTGWIERRVSARGNDTGFDFRNVMWARSKPDFRYFSLADNYATYDIPQFYNAKKENISIDFTGINKFSLNGTYFIISTSSTTYYVWFYDNEYAPLDPSVPYAVPISVGYYGSSQSLSDIVGAISSSISAQAYGVFTSELYGEAIVIENVVAEEIQTVSAGTSGASITEVQAGTNNLCEVGMVYQYTDPDFGGQNIVYCAKTTSSINPNSEYYFAWLYRENYPYALNGYFYATDVELYFMQTFGFSAIVLTVAYDNYEEYFSFSDGSQEERSDYDYMSMAIANSQNKEMPNFVIKGSGDDCIVSSYMYNTTVGGTMYRIRSLEVTDCYFGTYFQRVEVIGGNFSTSYFYTALSNEIIGGMSSSYFAGLYDSEVRNFNSLDYIENMFVSGNSVRCFVRGSNGNNIILGSLDSVETGSVISSNQFADVTYTKLPDNTSSNIFRELVTNSTWKGSLQQNTIYTEYVNNHSGEMIWSTLGSPGGEAFENNNLGPVRYSVIGSGFYDNFVTHPLEYRLIPDGVKSQCWIGPGNTGFGEAGVALGGYNQTMFGGIIMGQGGVVAAARSFVVGRATLYNPTRAALGAAIFAWQKNGSAHGQDHSTFSQAVDNLVTLDYYIDPTRTIMNLTFGEELYYGQHTPYCTYEIIDSDGGVDFTSFGAPNNDVGTRFEANGNTFPRLDANNGLRFMKFINAFRRHDVIHIISVDEGLDFSSEVIAVGTDFTITLADPIPEFSGNAYTVDINISPMLMALYSGEDNIPNSDYEPSMYVDTDGNVIAPNMPKVKQVEIDFGGNAVFELASDFGDTDVSLTNKINMWLAYEAPTDKQLDEVTMDTFQVLAQAGNAEILYFLRALEGPVSGKFKFNYTIN